MKHSQNDPKRNPKRKVGADGNTTAPDNKANTKAEPESGFFGRWSQRKRSA